MNAYTHTREIHTPGLLHLIMAENSDYENKLAKDEVRGSFITISYVVLLPIYFVLIFTVDSLIESLPTWSVVAFILFSPLFVALFLNRWNSRLEEK